MPVRHAKPPTADYPNKRPRLDVSSSTKSTSQPKPQPKPKATKTNATKPTTSSSNPKTIFTSAGQIRAALNHDDTDALVEALTALRNQLSIKSLDEQIPATDERLSLAKQWMESSPGAPELFSIWDKFSSSTTSNSRTPHSPLPLLLTTLSSLLHLLSAHHPNHPLGTALLRTLLAPARLRQLNSYLGGANNELILVTLRLYLEMSEWAGGKERKGVLEGFGWEIKSLPKLLNMRRKTHNSKDTTDPLIRPDIRTLLTLLILTFLALPTPAPLKSLFLEQHRSLLVLLFKGLKEDRYSLARRVLEVLWTGVWGDARVRRSVKVGVFGEGVLSQLVKLYERTDPEDDNPDHIPANLVHHFLLAICTRPGVGVCFKDRGWYPREASDLDDASFSFSFSRSQSHSQSHLGRDDGDRDEYGRGDWDGAGGGGGKKGTGAGRIYNKILAHFVKTLKVNEDARQQELALKILEACPELVAGYWSAASLTLEPRLSSKWITNIAVFGSIISLPVPTWSFVLPGSSPSFLSPPATSSTPQHQNQNQYNPTPPPLSTILASILPPHPTPTSLKGYFTKGLQAPSAGMVQHLTALALARCLLKFDAVIKEMRGVSRVLEEEEGAGVGVGGIGMGTGVGGIGKGFGEEGQGEGQWARRVREVEREVRKRVPDWSVVVAFGMSAGVGVGACPSHSPASTSKNDAQTKNAEGEGQAKSKSKSESKDAEKQPQAPTPNPTRTALLAESAQRLLWLYHRCLPGMVAETRFDVGKLLVGFVHPGQGAGKQKESGNEEGEDEQDQDEEEKEPDASTRLYRLQQLHILNLLKESEQFVWAGKIPSLGQTSFHVLLTALCSYSSHSGSGNGATSHSHQAIKSAILSVLQRVLSQSILFQEDPDEPGVWLGALPRLAGTRRRVYNPELEPELELFGDEVEGVIAFLDDCVQRCLKTPYKYVEVLQGVVASASTSTSSQSSQSSAPGTAPSIPIPIPLPQLPSPLLPTLIEQLDAKLNAGLLPASHVVGIAAYLRRLLYSLAGKAASSGAVEVVRAFGGKVEGVLSEERVVRLEKGMGKGKGALVGVVRREVELMRRCLAFGVEGDGDVDMSSPEEEDSGMVNYLNELEAKPLPQSTRLRKSQALTLITRLRALGPNRPVTTPVLKRIAQRIVHLDVSVLPTLVENVVPGQADVWHALGLELELELELDSGAKVNDLVPFLDFPYLLLHTTNQHILKESCQSLLARAVFSHSHSQQNKQDRATLLGVTRDVNFLMHRLAGVLHHREDGVIKGILSVLAKIFEVAKEHAALSEEDVVKLKEAVFGSSGVGVIRDVLMRPASGVIVQGIQQLLDASLDPASEADRTLVVDVSEHWFGVLTQNQERGLDSLPAESVSTACLWIKFLPPPRLFDLLDTLQTSLQSASTPDPDPTPLLLHPITTILQALCSLASASSSSASASSASSSSADRNDHADADAETMILDRLPQLLALRSVPSMSMRTSPLLEQVLARGVEASVPVGVDGCSALSVPGTTPEEVGLGSVMRRAERRWTRRGRHVNVTLGLEADLDIRSFLAQPTYTTWRVKIICGLIYHHAYSSSSPNEVIQEWVGSPECMQRSVECVLPVVHAFLDSLSSSSSSSSLKEDGDGNEGAVDPEIWTPFVPIMVRTLADPDVGREQHRLAESSLLALVAASVSVAKLAVVLDVLSKEVQGLPEKQVTPELLVTGSRLASKLGSKAASLVSVLVEQGLKACIDQFGDALETEDASRLAEALTLLLRHAPAANTNAKAVLVETLLTVVVQSRFASVVALRLASVALSTCQLKPVVVNRHLQSIIQHPYFFKICSSSSSSTSSSAKHPHLATRTALIELLYRLFHLHPTNTCQITHIEPLIKIYRGTLDPTDLQILSLFQLFETQRKVSVAPLLARWSASADGTSQAQSALEALQSLDPILVLRTCLNFPGWRRLEVEVEGERQVADQSGVKVLKHDAALYDPIFLMLLFGQMLAEQPPTTAFGWIELFRTNVVSLFIRALSARDGKVRELALSLVVGLYKQMETADLQEQPHVMYILNLLKDLMPAPGQSASPEYPRRLPTYTSLLLMHALRAVFHPSNFIYPLTARFLLQRPTLDTSDVPMLYGLLYSSSDENWKKERAWILKFLADGMVSSEDWRVLKRRHTWDLLASLFQSAHEGRDGSLRMAILEVLANLTCNAQATTSLVLKSALLQWVEMQLLYSSAKTEGVEWIKILENVIVIVDAAKIEAATNGEWRLIMCRCLGYLLDEKTCPTAADNFPHAVPVILRLAALPGPPLRDLSSLLDRAVSCLERLEASTQANKIIEPTSTKQKEAILHPPHRSVTLHQRLSSSDQGAIYATLLEMLWKVSMLIQVKSNAWEKLTPRMLLCGNGHLTSEERVDVFEWARKEVVRNLKVDQK